MSFTFKEFETTGNTIDAIVLQSAAVNSRSSFEAAARPAVEEVISSKDFFNGNYDANRIGYEAGKQVAVALIQHNLDL